MTKGICPCLDTIKDMYDEAMEQLYTVLPHSMLLRDLCLRFFTLLDMWLNIESNKQGDMITYST